MFEFELFLEARKFLFSVSENRMSIPLINVHSTR